MYWWASGEMFGLYSPNSEEEEGEQDADQTADGDFLGFVADSFFESGEIRFVEFEFFGETVEIARVLAHIDAQAKRVEDDDDGERECDGKRCLRKTVDKRDGGNQ